MKLNNLIFRLTQIEKLGLRLRILITENSLLYWGNFRVMINWQHLKIYVKKKLFHSCISYNLIVADTGSPPLKRKKVLNKPVIDISSLGSLDSMKFESPYIRIQSIAANLTSVTYLSTLSRQRKFIKYLCFLCLIP